MTKSVNYTRDAVNVMECRVSLTETGMKSTKDNYKAIEQVNISTQENSAGVEAIEDMVVRIRELAGKDNNQK